MSIILYYMSREAWASLSFTNDIEGPDMYHSDVTNLNNKNMEVLEMYDYSNLPSPWVQLSKGRQ